MDATESDFREAPSKMLDNWVWNEQALKRLSGHYKDSSSIPKNLLKNLLASRRANQGTRLLQEIIHATFDLVIHTREDVDTVRLEKELDRYLLGIETINGTSRGSQYGMDRYDTKDYLNLWSSVLAQDMFNTRFASEGIFNSKTGMDFRKRILKPGGSIEASVMLRNFLGRAPTKDAFFRTLGV